MKVDAQISFGGMHITVPKCPGNNRKRYFLLQHGTGKTMAKRVHSRRLANGSFDSAFCRYF